MTREEAIELFEKILAGAKQGLEEHPEEGKRVYGMRKELADMALSALRPVSREQVEKVWRGQWVKCKHADYYVCNKCSTVSKIGEDEFCKSCGAPMTDEAVEMVIRRLEALNENRD